MNKIERLIQGLCPDGVEWREVGEVANVGTGNNNTNEQVEEGEYPFFVRSKSIKRISTYSYDEKAIIIPGEGGIGEIFHYIDGKYGLHQRAYRIHFFNTKINTKFIYYYMQANFKSFIMKKAVSATVQSIRKPMIEKFKIPIPPLEIQEEIVKILDKFTDYVTELTTELTLRQKQYHYYRDKLLSLENEEFESKKLGEVCNFIRGNGLQKKDFVEKGFPVIHYGQIYTKYGFSARDTISFANGEIYNKLRKAKRGDIIMATTSENIEDLGKSVVWEGEQEVGISGDSYIIQTSQNPRFINYYLQSIHFQLQKEKKVTGTKVIRINSKDMVNFDIKVPSLLRQKQIVSILDNFDVLTSNLVFGLPKEIELRKKQYEYYRDKLLSFD